MVQARECYEAAIARDPAFARPYFGLADLLFGGVQFGLTRAGRPADDPRGHQAGPWIWMIPVPEAHSLQGVIRGLLDYDWTGAESSFRRALELGPGSATVLIQHA